MPTRKQGAYQRAARKKSNYFRVWPLRRVDHVFWGERCVATPRDSTILDVHQRTSASIRVAPKNPMLT